MSHTTRNSGLLWIALAACAMLPGVLLAVAGLSAPDPLKALVFGLAIIGAAFLLSWAAEAAQLDFSQGLALALLALIAILPEYVVDANFAWLAAEDPAYGSYALANMTGANRLLIGIAWPLVVGIAWLRFRRRHIELEPGHRLELVVLLAATIYAFTLPLKGTLSLIDMVVLVSMFGFYMWRVARMPAEPPHLVGPAQLIGALTPSSRRLATAALALGAAAGVILVAKPFAKALVNTGVALGIDEFLLVQWLAPLASEAPEFVVVALFAWRGATSAALGTLVSSKINQWTLLVAMLPLVYSIARGQPDALILDARQSEEVLLTAAQSLFAVTLLLNLRLGVLAAGTLFLLFVIQMVFPDTRLTVTALYGALTVLNLARLALEWRQGRQAPVEIRL
ncbi:MAG: sodium/calcium exchanger rane region [Chloroflexi bacterium]|nr:sodium/calcium exchanger rane region [Chloroflexota bacterium]